MPLGTEVGLGPGHFVLDGTQLPSPKRGGAPSLILRPCLYCGQTAEWIKMALGMEVGLGLGHIVLDWDPCLFPKKGAEPPPRNFSAHFYYGQTAGCIKMPLGIEIGLSPRDCVRWVPAPHPIGGGAPQFSAHVYCGQTAGWIKMPLGT